MPAMIDIAIDLAGIYDKGLKLLHVGAGLGQEISGYRKRGIEPICLEGDAGSVQVISAKYPDVQIHHIVASDKECDRWWYPTHPRECSSLHEIDREVAAKRFPSIRSLEPTTVHCTTVDQMWLPPVAALVVDVQGHDYEVLIGAEETLRTCELVVCEVWLKALYKGTKLLGEVKSYLTAQGFEMERFRPGSTPDFWGNAIFLRRDKWLY